MIGLIVGLWLALQTTYFQNWIVKKVSARLSSDLQAEIRLDRVELSLFNKLDLRGLLVKDQKNDTLLYAGNLQVNINDWFFFKDEIILHYIGLQDATISLNRSDSTWNYAYLIDYFGGGKKQKKGNVRIALEKLELENIRFRKIDGWRGEDQEWGVESLSLNAERFDTEKRNIHITHLEIEKPVFAITNYKGNRPEHLVPISKPTRFRNDTAHLRWNPDNWTVGIDVLELKDGHFTTTEKGRQPEDAYFDGSHIDFYAINGIFKQVQLRKDSIMAAASLSTKERSGFEVTQLRSDLRFHPEAMEFNNLDLRTPKSRLHHFFAMRYATFDDLGYFVSRVNMEGDFDDAELHSDDIAFFAPALKKWNTGIRITGKIKGPVEDLSAKNLLIQSGNSTSLNGNIRMRGLPDIENTFIDFDANELRTTYSDIAVMIPAIKRINEPRLQELRQMRFRGNFAGFFHDFVTYGTLESDMGTLISDLNMKYGKNGQITYSGNLATPGFHVGRLTGNDELGKIAFKGKVKGSGLDARSIKANLNGTIQKLEYKGYAYQNMQIDGIFSNRKFNGTFTANDPNLIGSLDGVIDLEGDSPHFDLLVYLDKIDFKKTNFTNENIDFKGILEFDFYGNDLDNFNGTVQIKEADIYHDGLRLPFDSLRLQSSAEGDRKTISLKSNEIDAALSGKFSIRDLPDALNGIMNRYYPSQFPQRRQTTTNEDFIFFVYAKNIQDYLHLFNQPWKGFNYSTLSGRIDDQQNIFDVEMDIPQFQYNTTTFYNLKIKGNGDKTRLGLDASIGLIELNENNSLPGTSIEIISSQDTSFLRLNTSANQTLNAANIHSRIITSRNGVSILFGPSDFEINGKKWNIQENGELILTKELVSAEGLKIFNGQQEITITSAPSDISNTNDIKVHLNKINIGDFSGYLLSSNRMEGLLTGDVDIVDPFGKLKVELQSEAEYFQLDNDSIGKLKLTAQYNRNTGRLGFSGLSPNEDYSFDIKGNYQFPDSSRDNSLDMTASLLHTKIDLLERYLSDIFSEMDGFASGSLRVKGPTEKLTYTGTVQLEKGRLKVGYTNVTYKIPRATVQFKEDRIDLGSIIIEDTLGNKGSLSRGIIKHQGFNGMEFDFALSTNKLLALNTTNATTDPYYGKVIAKATVTLNGPMDDMVLSIKGQPADSSSFFIKSGSSKESGQADFIVWKTYGTELEQEFLAKNGKLTILMDIAANNFVNMNVIIDELTNDIMSAIGHGNLRIKASTAGDFEMTGQIDIDQGNYNFNFQSLLRKPFKLAGEAGNYLRWNGDPYNADIKVTAEYKADNVKFSNLGDQLYLQTGSDVEYIKKFRGEVKVLAYLTGQLMRPDIRFSLQMPETSPLRNDPLVSNLLNRIQNDENELNKQVAFLLIFNNFGPLATSAQTGLGGQAWEGLVSSSISGLISNQLSKQFSSIFRRVFNDESIKVNFNAQLYNGAFLLSNGATSNFNIDRTNLNFSLAKSMFEERLTFTFGSAVDFGLTSTQARATNNLQFLPDITASWKLRPDGKLLLSFFYRDTYNYQSASGKQNRSGAGITFRRDFEQFNELWRNEKKKKKSTRVPDANSELERGTTGIGLDE